MRASDRESIIESAEKWGGMKARDGVSSVRSGREKAKGKSHVEAVNQFPDEKKCVKKCDGSRKKSTKAICRQTKIDNGFPVLAKIDNDSSESKNRK